MDYRGEQLRNPGLGLLDATYDALEAGLDVEYFHASEDRQAVRDQVLDRLEPYLKDLAVYAIVVDKRELTLDMRRAETCVFRAKPRVA